MNRQALFCQLSDLQELRRHYDYEELCTHDDKPIEILEDLDVDLLIEALTLILKAYDNDTDR